MLSPARANVVLFCLVEPSDLFQSINRVAISAGSVRFLNDNAEMGLFVLRQQP